MLKLAHGFNAEIDGEEEESSKGQEEWNKYIKNMIVFSCGLRAIYSLKYY